MAISSLANYRAGRDFPRQRLQVAKVTLATVAGRCFSGWLAGGFPAAGVAPTIAEVPTRATTGAFGQLDGTNNRLLSALLTPGAPAAGGMITIIDRLSHSGGLVANIATAQTTNLPSAALTRYTSGVGVMMGAEIYTVIGTTGTTITVSYTNTVPTSGQISLATTFGNTGFREASRMILLPLVSGQLGVTAVASATLAASTLTAGSFGITLFYPLVSIPWSTIDTIMSENFEALFGFGTWFPVVVTNACLSYLVHMTGTATGVVNGQINFAED